MLKKTSLLLIAGIVFIGLSIGITAEKNTIQKNISKQEQKTVSDKKDIKVTFVELGSVNCIPCKMMQPVMADIEKEYGTQVKVIFYDVWTKEGQPYSEKYKILVIPTQVFLDKDGKEFFRHQGFFPKEDIIKVLEKGGVKI
ncbi:MAG: thioredoxin family protein [Endomicrobiia bacterium]